MYFVTNVFRVEPGKTDMHHSHTQKEGTKNCVFKDYFLKDNFCIGLSYYFWYKYTIFFQPIITKHFIVII